MAAANNDIAGTGMPEQNNCIYANDNDRSIHQRGTPSSYDAIGTRRQVALWYQPQPALSAGVWDSGTIDEDITPSFFGATGARPQVASWYQSEPGATGTRYPSTSHQAQPAPPARDVESDRSFPSQSWRNVTEAHSLASHTITEEEALREDRRLAGEYWDLQERLGEGGVLEMLKEQKIIEIEKEKQRQIMKKRKMKSKIKNMNRSGKN